MPTRWFVHQRNSFTYHGINIRCFCSGSKRCLNMWSPQ